MWLKAGTSRFSTEEGALLWQLCPICFFSCGGSQLPHEQGQGTQCHQPLLHNWHGAWEQSCALTWHSARGKCPSGSPLVMAQPHRVLWSPLRLLNAFCLLSFDSTENRFVAERSRCSLSSNEGKSMGVLHIRHIAARKMFVMNQRTKGEQ